MTRPKPDGCTIFGGIKSPTAKLATFDPSRRRSPDRNRSNRPRPGGRGGLSSRWISHDYLRQENKILRSKLGARVFLTEATGAFW